MSSMRAQHANIVGDAKRAVESSVIHVAASDSDEDSSASDSNSSDDSSDDSDSSDDDDAQQLNVVSRIANAVKAKQLELLEARRHPVIEWREAKQWHVENAAGIARADEKQRRHAARVAAKAATRERREKRRAQRHVNKQKDTEFRVLVQRYDDEQVKSEKRTELLTAFSLDARAKEKQHAVETQLALQVEQARVARLKIKELHRADAQAKTVAARDLQLAIDSADEIARRCGLLPALNSPAAALRDEQDETSSLLILRLNAPDVAGSRSQSSALLPAVQATSTTVVSTISHSSNTIVGGEGRRGNSSSIALTRTLSVASVLPAAAMASLSSTAPATKRLFFTVNLKRFKHTEEIKGEAIGDRGGVELARSLLTGACPRVKRIDLGWNDLKYAAVAALADSFVRGACGQLQTLDLRCNRLDARSVQLLLSVLAKGALPELLDLVLQGNVISDDGAKALAHAMLSGTLQTLRTIDVRQNRIRNAGVQAIWHVFTSECFQRYCPKLELLDVRRNDASAALTRSFCPCPSYLAL